MTDTTQAALTANKRIEQFVKHRDDIAAIKARHVQELAPYMEVKALLEGWLMEFLKTAQGQSLKTAAGTVYLTTKFSAPLADADAFWAYVLETKNYDLVDRKANVTAVKDYVTKNKALPPGVNLNSIQTVGVQRGKGAAASED